MTGLRERNRRRTRREIADAALRLYEALGFAATSVDVIAEAAGVSRSTIFRYFPTKEHALFPTHDDDLADYRALLATTAGHPDPRRAILDAARDASRATVDAYRRDPAAYRRRQAVITTTPSVHALGLRLDRDWEDALAEAFARHLTGPDAALRAQLLAGGLLGAVHAFHRHWGAAGFPDDPGRHREVVMAVFEHGLDAALAAGSADDDR